MIQFIAGLFLGTLFGVGILCLCQVAKTDYRKDDETE